MIEPSFSEVARAIHRSGWRLVVAVTGGGSGAIAAMVQTPGASRTVLEAVVPYSQAAQVQWLGGAPDQACSAATARAMAMSAFIQARRLDAESDPRRLLGVGCTASLASDRPKRGEHRIHVAVQTARETWSYSLPLVKDRRDRSGEELAATALTLWAIAAACGVEGRPAGDLLPPDGDEERLESDYERAPLAIAELLLGQRRCAVLKSGSTTEYFDAAQTPRLTAVFPGAFNPPHQGHLGMAAEAERRLGGPVAWEVSIANVDKPPLDYISIRERLAGLRREDDKRMAALTCSPTFREKAELFPGVVFVVGADTLLRIGDEHYYGDDDRGRDAAIAAIAQQGCRFLVFGREVAGRFQTLADLAIPAPLRMICDEVPAADFREDVSSTALRGGA